MSIGIRFSKVTSTGRSRRNRSSINQQILRYNNDIYCTSSIYRVRNEVHSEKGTHFLQETNTMGYDAMQCDATQYCTRARNASTKQCKYNTETKHGVCWLVGGFAFWALRTVSHRFLFVWKSEWTNNQRPIYVIVRRGPNNILYV